MDENSIYKRIEDTLDEINVPEDELFLCDTTYKNLNIISSLTVVSKILDISSTDCKYCLDKKMELLKISRDFKMYFLSPNKYKKITKKLYFFMKEFIEHFNETHNEKLDIIVDKYKVNDYYRFAIISQMFLHKKLLERKYERYDFEFLDICFFRLDSIILSEEFLLKAFSVIKDLLYNENEKEAEKKYIDFIEITLELMDKMRQEYLEDEDEKYELFDEVNISIKGREILKIEKARQKDGGIISKFIKKNSAINSLYSKEVDELNFLILCIEDLKEDCSECRQLKRELMIYLEELRENDFEKLYFKKKYTNFFKKHKKFIKTYKDHMKIVHKNFDGNKFNKRYSTLSGILFLIVIIFSLIVSFKISKKYNLDAQIITFIILIVAIYGFTVISRKIYNKIIFFIAKKGEK